MSGNLGYNITVGRFAAKESGLRKIFGHWEYIFKNVWFVLPFAVMPALFLALSVDFEGVHSLCEKYFTGSFGFDFYEIFRAFSLLRVDSVLGAIYSVCALVCIVFFLSPMLSLVEKHMRIGKRTFSGAFSRLGGVILSTALVAFLYLALYELWALVLSAVLFAVGSIPAAVVAHILFVVVLAAFFAALVFLVPTFYLLLPCMQITGFGFLDALFYSYRLVVGVRGRLMLSMTVSLLPALVAICGASFLPAFAATCIAFVLFLALFLSFTVRMETLYFETDKLDREDVIRSYREL